MIDIYDCIESAAIVTTFNMINYIIKTGGAEKALEKYVDLDKCFREKLGRVQSNVSKKVSETVVKIWAASVLRSYNEPNESEDSE